MSAFSNARTASDAFMRESIAHPAPALGVVLVEFTQYLNDLRVSNLSGRQRLFQPLVMRLLRKPQHPARHRHRHSNAGTGRGHLLDEWEHYFGGVI
ncbi:hypothetical protein DHOM_10225 [Dermabacter hominis 1368]|uniref:Uncharacterized protein n=1 Tax=Dermabacter hominis 1368 TaxID=1450519 RepID=A0ABR4SHB1_9MICO|nr:hypothetical protein DHOM_10225 [Dermabacter hominis 1368]